MSVTVHHGDSREVLKGLADASIDSVVCDPPYALVSIGKRYGKEGAAASAGVYGRATAGFMGKTWDVGETAFAVEFWAEVYRVLKPGGHVIAFSGTRTYHRLACAVEDAGFEIRDQIGWLYGSGFPKSHNVAKGIDKALGAERQVISEGKPVKRMIPGADQHKGGWEKNNGREFVPTVTAPATRESSEWEGWGTALKPAWEPIVLARKPLEGSVAANVLKHGTGAINIEASRIGWQSDADAAAAAAAAGFADSRARGTAKQSVSIGKESRDGTNTYDPMAIKGRWPANVVHDGSDEVLGAFPESEDGVAGARKGVAHVTLQGLGAQPAWGGYGGEGSSARFFYSAKADAEDRHGSKHPTVKPVDLMVWLCRLVTPPGGTILDPFAGTGTTGLAAMREGFDCILVEREAEYIADIHRRIAWANGEGRLTVLEQARDICPVAAAGEDLPLFATQETAQPASQPASQRLVYGKFARDVASGRLE